MDRFNTCLAIILPIEGGYSDRPADLGGPTNHGITQTTYDSWRTRHSLPKQPVIHITDDEVRAIYKQEYWDFNHCASLSAPIDLLHFNTAIQAGPGDAGRILQRAAGMPPAQVDGVVGNVTLSFVKTRDPMTLAAVYTVLLIDHYVQRVEDNASQLANLHGWLRRTGILLAAT
jgi:lysozyme family protein